MNLTPNFRNARMSETRGPNRSRQVRKLRDLASFRKLEYLINGFLHAGWIYDSSLFTMATRYLTAAEKRRIVLAAFDRARKIKLDIKSYESNFRDGTDSPKEILDSLQRNARLSTLIFNSILNILIGLVENAPRSTIKCRLETRLDEVCSVFGLNEAEREVLLLLHLSQTDNGVERIFNETNGVTDSKSSNGSIKARKTIMVLTGFSKHEVAAAVSQKSTLLRVGLVGCDGELVLDIIDFLEGASDKPFCSRYFSEYAGDVVPIDVHSVDRKHIDTVKTLKQHKAAGRGINVLLYGEPGTGKTEFARSLGKSLSLPVYEISNLNDQLGARDDLNLFRYRAYLACQKMTDPEGSIILVDEADSLLNSITSFFSLEPTAEKGQINHLLDESKSFTIWITNRYRGIDDSTKRRFDYSIGFEKMTFTQRRAVWQHSMVKHGLAGCLDKADIDSLASEYEINAGGIDVAMRNAARIMARGEPKERVIEVMHSLMKAHLRILDCDKNADVKKAAAPEYSLDGLNIKGNITTVLTVIDRFNVSWSGADRNMSVRNMNLLLYGPPGTGKTEFAKYIARRTNRRLMVKRASDLLNCWVGESEKNIRRAFEEAERDKAILFIDEADSMFWSREGASHSWEVTQVNEVLTNMETFAGMLICSTNFRMLVDTAAIRRFGIKLEFDYLKPVGAMTFYSLFLARLAPEPLSEPEIGQVKSLVNLAPGDFKVVHQKYSFFDKKELSHATLIDALRQELATKDSKYRKTMGFAQA